MGSTYRPRGQDRGSARDRDRYDDLPPRPPPSRRADLIDSRRNDDGRRDGYGRGSQYQPTYDRGPHDRDSRYQESYHHQPPPPAYTFRGAASHDRDAPRAEDRFTFESRNGPTGPRFPSAHEQPLPPRPRRGGDRPPRGPRNGPAAGKHGNGDRPRRFGPRPAHARDLLTRSTREATPEQLAGMNAHLVPKFRDVEEDEYVSGSDDTNGDTPELDRDEEGGRKRVKTQPDVDVAPPKWSNPDPYTALPPPSQTNGPKKDIVETIRKAKNDQSHDAAASNPVKDNIDFISFDDDEVKPDMSEEEEEDQDFRLKPGGGRKRAHSDISPDDVLGGEITLEWLSDGFNPTPWCSSDGLFTASVGLKLHKEIADFYEFVKPLESERRVRQDIASRIERAIQTWYHGRGVRIYCFGSFPAGLFLPTADMDLVALSPQFLERATPAFCLSLTDKKKLRSILRGQSIFDPVTGADIIAFAKVPLIKFTDLQTGLKVDISFENHTGLEAQTTLKDWKAQFPDMPVLVAIIKQFLAMRNLNEVFRGGIGGFTIICLVVSMLQHMPEYQANSHEPHTRYGELLMNFFDLYGNKFNYRTTGIVMNPPSYFDKDKEGRRGHVKYQEDRLTIIDPNRPDNDISGGSRLIREVFDCFRGAHSLVQRRLDEMHKGKAKSPSILECILGGNYSTYIDVRARLRRVYQRNYPDEVAAHSPSEPSFGSATHKAPAGKAQSQKSSKPKSSKKSKDAKPTRSSSKSGNPPPPTSKKNKPTDTAKVERRKAKKKAKKEAKRKANSG